MYYKNNLTTILLTVFIGTIFTPSIGMEKNNRIKHQFEEAKQLINAFLITKFTQRDDSEFGRNKDTKPNGLDFYRKTIQEVEQKNKYLKERDVHKCAKNELLKLCCKQQEEIDHNLLSAIVQQSLCRQTIIDQNSYGSRKFFQEILDILYNTQKIDRKIAKRAFREYLREVFSNPRYLGATEALINETDLQENSLANNPQGTISLPKRVESSLMARLCSIVINYPLTSIGITTIVLCFLLYRLVGSITSFTGPILGMSFLKN